jgi:hypothetical protein
MVATEIKVRAIKNVDPEDTSDQVPVRIAMTKRRARTNSEVANFAIGCGDACRLEHEIHAIMDDEPINLDHLELRLREAIGAADVTGTSHSVQTFNEVNWARGTP